MPKRDSFSIALGRYAFAKPLAESLGNDLKNLIERRALVGLKFEDFPPSVDKSVQGFDLAFADQRIRVVVSGSAQESGHLTIRCWRVPLVDGPDLSILAELEVSRDGEIKFPGDEVTYWIESPSGAMDFVCYLVELVNTSRNR
jgi:hypothetical protein